MVDDSLAGKQDIREEPLFKEVEEHFRRLIGPALGRVTGAVDPEISPDGSQIAFTGTMWQKLEGLPVSRVCVAGVDRGGYEVVTGGPNSDRRQEEKAQ